MKYAFIQNNSDVFPVKTMCEVMRVSSSAYYRWVENPISKTDLRHYELDNEISAIFADHKGRYGSKRIYEELKDNDWKVTEKKVSERMKVMNLVAKGVLSH